MKFKKYISLLLIISSIVLFQIPGTANATTYGGRWYKDIKMYIESNNEGVIGSFGVATLSWNRALSEADSSIRINHVYSSSEANLIISDKDYLGSPVGVSNVSPGFSSASYTSGSVVMNLNKFNQLSSSEQTAAATHELGHILGLDHSPSNVSSIMNSLICTISFPTSYDKSEID